MSNRDDELDRTAREAPAGGGSFASVESLASEALQTVAQRRLTASSQLFEYFVQQLQTAIADPDATARDNVLAALRRSRFSDDDIAEVIVPEVARRMGDAWCEDTSSFAAVTIGVARLQGMLRELSATHADSAPVSSVDPMGIAVVVVATEDHTLGAMVLARILRRLGASVRLMVGKPDADVVNVINTGDYDGVMISAASVDRLPRVKGLVDLLKRAINNRVPIVVGGFAVQSLNDPKKATGADHIESDPEKALELCGLTISRQDGAQRERSG